MAEPPEYDATLTQRLREELDRLEASGASALGALTSAVDRIERRARSLLSGHDLDRLLDFLHPPLPETASPPPVPSGIHAAHPMVRSLTEMLGLSRQLDGVDDPTRGLSVGEHVARRAHALARALDGALAALDPAEAAAKALHRLLSYASELVRNAVARIRQFALRLGVTSFSVTLASVPPELSVTFTFGAP